MPTFAPPARGYCQATVNGGPPMQCEFRLTRNREVQYVEHQSRADPRWSYTDPAGHFHAWAAPVDGDRPTLPTLDSRRVHLPCNGQCGDPEDCDGFHEERWSCRICHAAVLPGWKEEYNVPFAIVGPVEWQVLLHVLPEADLSWLALREVSVLLTRPPAPDLFGVARPILAEQSAGGPGGEMTRVELTSGGPLGQRLAA